MNTSPPLTQREGAATELASALSGIVRSGHLVKHGYLASTGLENGSVPVLFLAAEEPRRISEIAALCHTDTSTTSRHVATLARLGLVAKVPDASDRRASVIELTEAGHETLASVRRRRAQLFAEVLSDWDLHDIDALTDGLHRLSSSVETYLIAHRTTKGA